MCEKSEYFEQCFWLVQLEMQGRGGCEIRGRGSGHLSLGLVLVVRRRKGFKN